MRGGGGLSLKQVATIAAAIGVTYFISANHGVLRSTFQHTKAPAATATVKNDK